MRLRLWRSLLLKVVQPFGHQFVRWLFIGAALLLWLILIVLVVLQQPQDGTICARGTKTDGEGVQPQTKNCDHFQSQMDTIRADLIALKNENRKLKKDSIAFRPPTNQFDQNAQRLYSKGHELARRELDRLIMELFMRLNGHEPLGMPKEEGQREKRRLNDQLLHLLAHSRKFAQVDGADQWHRQALARAGSRIQNALHALQHPADCGKARLLLCELNKGCGFGCQLHHVAYCLIMAAAANRTMVLERDGAEWRYSRDGWTAVFQPVGTCTFAEHVPLAVTVDQFSGRQQQNSTRIVRLPVVDGLSSRPPHLPLAFPAELVDLLLTHHSNPPVYFIGQFVDFLMRKNARCRKFVEEALKRIPFGLGPVVGVQIRRTDKVGTEAALHHVREYMRWADLWFAVEQTKLGIPLEKRVFIATDDKSVIEEARAEWGQKGFVIMANDETAEAAQPSNRYSDRSLLGVIADVHILAHCSFIVCTFSSQVCRLSYELMQALQGDAAERVHSLDDIFYFGGQLAHEWEAVGEFRAETDDEIDLRPGDLIGVAGNHWDGFSKGTNRRTRRSGLFPSYLAREKWRIVDFAIFGHDKNNGSDDGTQ
uniref:Alpha-(1,6)-fucosyltransferase n=1 Tax=Globodera rostochiensis TaxID=31243 RepID=A0A914I7M1_GLORO